MDTLSWLELMIFVVVVAGTAMYHFGHRMGREQQKIDHAGRLASMRNHPSYVLRVKQWEEDKS